MRSVSKVDPGSLIPVRFVIVMVTWETICDAVASRGKREADPLRGERSHRNE